MQLDEVFLKFYRKIDKRYIVAFFSTIIAGVLAHGMALFNKYSFHDDTYSMFTVGATFTSGRYMLYEVSHFIQTKIGGLFSTPLYEGMITIVFIAFSSILLISLLKIKSKVLCALAAIFMVSFPVPCRNGYAWFYVYGLLLFWGVVFYGFGRISNLPV